jgi:hypothetical protein
MDRNCVSAPPWRAVATPHRATCMAVIVAGGAVLQQRGQPRSTSLPAVRSSVPESRFVPIQFGGLPLEGRFYLIPNCSG